MTQEQKGQLDELLWAVSAVAREASGSYIPYELAQAITRADAAAGEVRQFAHALSAGAAPE